MNNLATFLKSCAKQHKTILLYDSRHTLVGSLLPELLDITKVAITQDMRLSEKFCFYYSGVALFFSYYKISEEAANNIEKK